jgi:septum site-determining protein MinC
MSTQTTLKKTTSGIALKGGMFTLTAIQLLDYDLEALSFELDEKIKQAPSFFHYAPIILDVQRLRSVAEEIDFPSLVVTLKSKNLIPIGVRGASKLMKEAAIAAGLAIFPEEKILPAKKQEPEPTTEQTFIEPTAPVQPLSNTPTRFITQPVRSGQQIYVPGGDLIVFSSVSNGAEILADGHIHVYGPLRGRALAGVLGDKDARIFCKSLEAELVSIAGHYRVCEDLKEPHWKQSVCIQLQDERLHIRGA